MRYRATLLALVVVVPLVGSGGIGYYLDRQDRTRTQAAPAQARPGETVNLTTTDTVLTSVGLVSQTYPTGEVL